nr:monocarboxylate transporter 10-like isoform X1 [Megalopta genalis]
MAAAIVESEISAGQATAKGSANDLSGYRKAGNDGGMERYFLAALREDHEDREDNEDRSEDDVSTAGFDTVRGGVSRRSPLIKHDKESNEGTIEPSDRSSSFRARSGNVNVPENDARKFRVCGRKRPGVDFRVDDGVKVKSNSLQDETSISARAVCKVSNERRGSGTMDPGKDQDDSRVPAPRNHLNLILDRIDGCRHSEAPRKPVDSLKDSGVGTSEKTLEDVAASRTSRSASQDTGRIAGRRSPDDAAPVHGHENSGESRVSRDRRLYLERYAGYLDGYEEKDANDREGNHEPPVASLLYRSRSLPRLSMHDSGVACSGNEQTPADRPIQNTKQWVADWKQLHTLKQHYYPEGGWGWIVMVVGVIVQMLSHGIHGASGILLQQVAGMFGRHEYLESGWLGAISTGVALLVSPVTIALCRRKSTRLTAVLGGLVTALGCLFTSFATQFHQLFFSYGTVVGIGVGLTRDCSTLMVAQYFKRRRELVEIFVVSGSGLGIAVMSAFIKGAISKIGWRLGLQAVTGVVFLTFILGTFYRSASLYHPQRRAILHLKNQKRKIKDKNKTDDRPPFFDFSTLKSKTVRILLMSTGISAFGINTPIFYLAHQVEEEGLGDTVILLQAYLGLAWTLGCVAFGLLVVHRSVECRIARQYLTQAAVFVCGVCILALTAVQGNYHGYVMFAWIYGIFCGGYHYSLKMYTYERVRARNFARTWGFVQCSQAIPIAIGVPISGYMNVGYGGKAGYYFSSTCVLVGSFTLFFIDLHRRSLSRHKHTKSNGTKHLCISDSCPQRRRLSFSQEPENDSPHVAAAGAAAAALVLGAEISPTPGI